MKKEKQKLQALEALVGNTPLIRIDFKYKGEQRAVFAKLEYYNFSGSVKDRMALYILKDAYNKGEIAEGFEICEATSGNTGIAFSAQGAFLGHKVKIFMPDWMSVERVSLIKSFGAEIVPVSKEQGGFIGSVNMAKEYAKRQGVFMPRQFENEANTEAHYSTTAPEIWDSLQKIGVTPDGFVAGVGSGGTVMGVGKFLKEKNPACKIFPMEPENSPTMTTGGKKIGNHRIQGISDEFIPQVVKLEKLDEIISVDDGDSIIAAQMLAQKLGLGVGVSSGANLLAAIKSQNKFGLQNVVTIFSDDNKKYLSTDYAKVEPLKKGFLSPDLELLGFEVI